MTHAVSLERAGVGVRLFLRLWEIRSREPCVGQRLGSRPRRPDASPQQRAMRGCNPISGAASKQARGSEAALVKANPVHESFFFPSLVPALSVVAVVVGFRPAVAPSHATSPARKKEFPTCWAANISQVSPGRSCGPWMGHARCRTCCP